MLPDDLANRLTPTGFAEQCAYIEIKAETLEAARAKVVAPATKPERKAKMGTQRRQPT